MMPIATEITAASTATTSSRVDVRRSTSTHAAPAGSAAVADGEGLGAASPDAPSAATGRATAGARTAASRAPGTTIA